VRVRLRLVVRRADDLAREAAGLARVDEDFARVVEDLDRAVEPEDFARLEERELVARLVDPERDEVRRLVGLRRSEAGISSVTTALVSCGNCLVRKAAIRSSCLRCSRASFSVSLSPRALASSSIAM